MAQRKTQRMAHGQRRFFQTFLVVMLLAALVRLAGSASRPLWYDEAFAVLFAEKGPAAMLAGTLAPTGSVAADVHPLLYYTSLWAWMRLFGQQPWAVRLLSILFGLGTVALAFGLAAGLFGRRAAPWLAAPAALSPLLIHYSQEVRMYALLALALTAATWAFWRGLHGGGWPAWLAFSVFAALAQYTHNLAAVYLLPLALTPLLARRWQSVLPTLLAGLGAVLLYLPWLLRLPQQLARLQQSYWTVRPGPSRLLTALLSYVTNLPLPGPWLPAGLFVTLLVVALAFWQTWRATRAGLPGAQRAAWLAYLAFAPLVLLFAISQVQPVFIERALLPSGVMFALWAGWAFFATPLPRPVQAVVVGLLAAGITIGLYQHLTYAGFPYAPYAALDHYLEEHVKPGEVVIHSNKLSLLPAVYYNRHLPQRYIADPPGSGSDTLGLPTQQVLGLLADPGIEQAAGEAETVYFVVFKREIEEYQALGEATHPALAWLDEHYVLAPAQEWGELSLYIFHREQP